jgi:uncharacterized phage protein (TIGR02218 family)
MSYDGRESSRDGGAPYELYKFTTQTQTWRYTSADEEKTFDGFTYEPLAITRTDATHGQELKSGEVKVRIPQDHEISQLFIGYIPSTPMFLTIYRAHYGEAEIETVVHWTGKASVGNHIEDLFEITCVPSQEALKKRIPAAKYQAQCNRFLYSPGCGVNRLDYRVLGTLTSVVGDVLRAPEFATKPDGFFTNGYIEFGVQRRFITAHVEDSVVLITPLNGINAGDQLYAYAGCDRFYNGDCVNKFDNGENYFGFEWLPNRNPFNGLE